MPKSDIYYGSGPIPKSKRRATMIEAIQDKRVNYWGVNKVDGRLFDKSNVMNKKKDNNHIEKISDVVSNIKKLIKIKGKYIWYVIINNEIKLVSTGKNKKKAKEEAYLKIAKDNKFVDLTFYLVTMVIDSKIIGNNTFTKPGPFNIFTEKYTLNKKHKLISQDSYGTVWFSDKNILDYGFKTSFFKEILKSIDDNKIKTDIVNMTTFDKFKI